jgi:hypothetical protein
MQVVDFIFQWLSELTEQWRAIKSVLQGHEARLKALEKKVRELSDP